MFLWLSLRTSADSNGIQAAPKIGESNIGFKMLASMGWEEGVRIGGETGGETDGEKTIEMTEARSWTTPLREGLGGRRVDRTCAEARYCR